MFEQGVKTKKDADALLAKIDRAPGDWAKFTSGDSARLLAVLESSYAPEPLDDLFS